VRGELAGVRSRHPIGGTLPAMLQDDPFLQRFTAGFDDLLVPFLATLDSLHGYVDPALAPEDFLDWLAGWVGLDLDPRWPLDVRRALLGRAAEVQDARGTVAGLRAELGLLTGCRVEVCEPGGVATSTESGAALPETAAERAAVVVRVLDAPPELRDPAGEARARLDRAARAAVPAHLPVSVEVLP
jgi:phage tail-like protein